MDILKAIKSNNAIRFSEVSIEIIVLKASYRKKKGISYISGTRICDEPLVQRT